MTFQWTCTSGELIVSDPSYRRSYANGSLFLSKRVKAKIGTWLSTIVCSSNKRKCKVKKVIHAVIDLNQKEKLNPETDIVAVDSGYLCVCDYAFYPSGASTGNYLSYQTFYGKCCRVARDLGGIIDDIGFVCKTEGVGSFTTKFYRNSLDEVVKIETTFISD